MRKIERIFVHCTVSPLSRGLHRCDAVGGKPMGMARCRADFCIMTFFCTLHKKNVT